MVSIHAGSKPVYTIEAQLNQASVPAIGLLFHQNWGSGTVNVATHLKMSGLSQADLLSSAQGMYHLRLEQGRPAFGSEDEHAIAFLPLRAMDRRWRYWQLNPYTRSKSADG